MSEVSRREKGAATKPLSAGRLAWVMLQKLPGKAPAQREMGRR